MSGRHKRIERVCEQCGKSFMALEYRVKKGQGRFCSLKCSNLWQKENSTSELIGKENASIYFQKKANRYCVTWMDEKTGKQRNSTWAKWAWEMNFGKIPKGKVVRFKDGDAMNTSLDNLYLDTQGSWNTPPEMTKELRERLSKIHTGKVLSEEHKNNIGNATRQRWANGDYEDVHVGEHNKKWRGGISNGYPREYKKVTKFIRERDNQTCQICGKRKLTNRNGHVHHIDGNRNHNDLENLILLCAYCHANVHGVYDTSPVIMSFREQLEWYDG